MAIFLILTRKKKEKSKKADKDYRSKNIAKEEAFDE